MKICARCNWNFNGVCAEAHYGVNCDETPVSTECEMFRNIPGFLHNADKPRVLNPKDYTEEMAMSDQGYKRCPHCKKVINEDLKICDECGAVL